MGRGSAHKSSREEGCDGDLRHLPAHTLPSSLVRVLSSVLWCLPGYEHVRANTEGWSPDSGKYALEAFAFADVPTYVPFILMNTLLIYAIIWAFMTVGAFLALYPPSRHAFIGSWLSIIGVQIFNRLYITAFLGRYASSATSITHPRLFLLLDWLYSFSIGLVVATSAALLRFAIVMSVSILFSLLPHRPLFSRPFQLLDRGFAMHGAMLKTSYAQGRPPPFDEGNLALDARMGHTFDAVAGVHAQHSARSTAGANVHEQEEGGRAAVAAGGSSVR